MNKNAIEKSRKNITGRKELKKEGMNKNERMKLKRKEAIKIERKNNKMRNK